MNATTTPVALTTPRAPQETPWHLKVLGTPSVALVVFGEPKPQGSKTAFAGRRKNKTTREWEFTGKAHMKEAVKGVADWRAAVKSIAVAYVDQHPSHEPLDGPLIADLVFTMPKPAGKPRYAIWPWWKPDLSKLARSTEDSLSGGGVWRDDARVIAYRRLEKLYVGADDHDTLPTPGVVIRVWRLPQWMVDERRARR